MAGDPIKRRHPAIFLSASIPTQDRAQRYFETADIIAIRESVKALLAVAVPPFAMVWGGHPSITPLIRLLAESHREDIRDFFAIYQSRVFKNVAPKDNEFFRHVHWIDSSENLDGSLRTMRRHMVSEPNYIAGFFIGGMDGIETEFNEFREANPYVPVFPIASTGGAANILFQRWAKPLNFSPALEDEIAYPFLFRRLLAQIRFERL